MEISALQRLYQVALQVWFYSTEVKIVKCGILDGKVCDSVRYFLVAHSWLINTRSQLSIDNKLTAYKAILRPIWTYGVELWGMQ